MRNNKEYLTIGIGWIGIFIMLLILICTSSCTKKNNTINNTNSNNTTNTPIIYTDWNGTFHEVNTIGDTFILSRISGTNNYLITNSWIWNSYIHNCYTNDNIDLYHIDNNITYQCGNYNVSFKGEKYDTLYVLCNTIKYKYVR